MDPTTDLTETQHMHQEEQLRYTDDELLSLIKERYLQDARLDAAIDVFIFKCFRIQFPDINPWDFHHTHDLERQHKDIPFPEAGRFYPPLADRQPWDHPFFAAEHEQFLQHVNATTSFTEFYKQHKQRFVKRWRYLRGDDYDFNTSSRSSKYIANDPFITDANRVMLSERRSKHILNLSAFDDLIYNHSKHILKGLQDVFQEHKTSAIFACSGAVQPNQEASQPSPTVWYETSDNQPHRLHFPTQDMKQLAEACSPASFGFKGENIVDPAYRSALKLDNTKFATNFHPYDHGIVQTIQKMLLPAVLAERSSVSTSSCAYILTELYKLNIYAGPSDHFRPHVDTPRSEKQFGSLVVCLPSPHEGGNLLVRHNSREINYSWGEENPTSLKWAAFYSDCEHEVLQVRSGYRCTLTYNLYVETLDSVPPSLTPFIDVDKLPLFTEVQHMLQNCDFMPQGGVLGFYADHRYPHADKVEHATLPGALKGVDAALYAVFARLGVTVSLRPLYEGWALGEDEYRYKGMLNHRLYQFQKTGITNRRSLSEEHRSNELGELGYKENTELIPEAFSSFESRHKLLKDRRTVAGYYEEGEDLFLGTKFCGAKYVEEGGEDGPPGGEILAGNFPTGRIMDHIYWINNENKDNEELSLMYLTYGNEAGLGTIYSKAVILAVIPEYSEDRGTRAGAGVDVTAFGEDRDSSPKGEKRTQMGHEQVE